MSDNGHKHVFMDDELADNLKREFDRLAEGGGIGNPKGTPAYAYLRVSSRGQAEEGASGLPRQLEHVAERATAEGLAIPWEMVFCDDHSGFSFEDRPALQALMEEVKDNRRSTTIVVEYADRMSRDHTWRYGYIREQFQKAGVEYVYWQGYHSEIERSVLGTISEQGMRQALQRMQYGRLRKARSGRITAQTPAYGYKFVDSQGRDRTDPESKWRKDKHYTIVADEAEVMRLIYHRLAYDGDTLLAIANYLNECQVPPPKNSREWQQTLLSKMVKNTLYKGEFAAHQWYSKKVKSERSGQMVTRKFERPRDEWIIVAAPAIISAKVWSLAQETMTKNRTLSTRKAKYPFLLQGLMVCDGCGHAYGASARLRHRNGGDYWIACYKCGGRHYQVKVVRERIGCKQSQISAQKLDPVVWKVIMEILTEPSNLTRALDEYYADTGAEEIQRQISFVDEQMAQRQAEDEKLYRAYVKGVFDEEEYAARRREVKAALQTLQEERDRLTARLMTEEDLARHKAAIADTANKMRQKLTTMEIPFAVKRRIVRMLVDHIELNVNEGWFKIHGVLRGTFSLDGASYDNTHAGRGSWRQ